MTILNRIATDAAEWARGKNPWVRPPLLLWMAHILVRHMGDPEYGSLIAGLNLGIHELGHGKHQTCGGTRASVSSEAREFRLIRTATRPVRGLLLHPNTTTKPGRHDNG